MEGEESDGNECVVKALFCQWLTCLLSLTDLSLGDGSEGVNQLEFDGQVWRLLNKPTALLHHRGHSLRHGGSKRQGILYRSVIHTRGNLSLKNSLIP